jgi:cleavage stimulation factor subunit 3
MESEHDNFEIIENIFGRGLMTVLNVSLWNVYLNYIRRRNDLITDVTGRARSTISSAYDFALDNIGIDKDSGRIWQDYIQFVKSAPGVAGGTSWQDQQKMDQVRSAYQRAINVPMSTLNTLWKEYDQFELSLNKTTVSYHIDFSLIATNKSRAANLLWKKWLVTCLRGLPTTT